MDEPTEEKPNGAAAAPPMASLSVALSHASHHLFQAALSRSKSSSATHRTLERVSCTPPVAQSSVLRRPKIVPLLQKPGLLTEDNDAAPRKRRFKRRSPTHMAVPEPVLTPSSSALDKLLERSMRLNPFSLGGGSDVPTDPGGAGGLDFDPLLLASAGGAKGKGVVERGGPKTVLILMSDTGGGHRASAQALKSAFFLEFGTQYEVSTDGGVSFGMFSASSWASCMSATFELMTLLDAAGNAEFSGPLSQVKGSS